MWKGVILALVLVTFGGLQFVDSLICYTCNSPQACNSPYTVTCSDAAANTTSSWLNATHTVPVVVHSNSFRCMNLTYVTNNVKSYEYLGCYHPSIDVCNLNTTITGSPKVIKCYTCNSDHCNRNPAGVLSKSTYTILGSILALILAAKSF